MIREIRLANNGEEELEGGRITPRSSSSRFHSCSLRSFNIRSSGKGGREGGGERENKRRRRKGEADCGQQ
jgi:hypothetical protein